MRTIRRITAISCTLTFSIFVFATQQAEAQSSAQTSSQPSSQPSAQTAAQPSANSQAGETALSSAARELARKVAAAVGTALEGQLTIEANPRNLSSASPIQFQQGISAFRDELMQASKAQAVSPAPNAAVTPSNVTPGAAGAATVRVALSENFSGFLWVAEVTQGNAKKTLFVSVPRAMVAEGSHAAASVVLEKEFVLSLPEKILDVAVLPASPGSAKRVLVLEPESVALYAQNNGEWEMESQAAIPHDKPWPRDVRGLLVVTGDSAQATLPGVSCEIALANSANSSASNGGSSINTSASITANCKPGNPGWMLSLGFPRAFTLLPITTDEGDVFAFVALGAQEFDSLAVVAAPTTSGGPVPVVGTTPNGRALLFDGGLTPVASFSGWGSDVAALYSSNRNQWPVLVTGAGDWSAADTIQAFDISDEQALPASGAINFDGPVTALWSKGEDAAMAIARNLTTGMYEAYRIQASYPQ